jgi:hypothetical protein
MTTALDTAIDRFGERVKLVFGKYGLFDLDMGGRFADSDHLVSQVAMEIHRTKEPLEFHNAVYQHFKERGIDFYNFNEFRDVSDDLRS